MKLNTGRNKYVIWAVMPSNQYDQPTKSLVYAALGLKKDVKRRWWELTYRGEHHMPLLFWQNTKKLLKHINYIRFEVHKTFDWKPDALKYMRLLAAQHKFLLVEDLTNDRLGQPGFAGVRGSGSYQSATRSDPQADVGREEHQHSSSEEQPWVRPDSLSG